MNTNWQTCLDFVWQKGFDSPEDGYHTTPGDSGLGTFGGVIEATWQTLAAQGVVTGALRNATPTSLAVALRAAVWVPAGCDALPGGLDLMVFNGHMMTGYYLKLFQQCLGFVGPDVDGQIGPETIEECSHANTETLIYALHGVHYAYLAKLEAWPKFGNGWLTRLMAAHSQALLMVNPPLVSS